VTLNKTDQKSIIGGIEFREYLDHCGPAANGLVCLTGLPHCPTGRCANGICSPDTDD